MKRLMVCALVLLAATAAGNPSDRRPERRKGRNAAERQADTNVYDKREVLPRFNGGSVEYFRRWVALRVSYSEEMYRLKLEGRVTVVFIVERDGSTTITDILESPDVLLTQEVVRVLRSAPRWTPGMLLNEKTGQMDTVRVRFVLPVDFSLRNARK